MHKLAIALFATLALASANVSITIDPFNPTNLLTHEQPIDLVRTYWNSLFDRKALKDGHIQFGACDAKSPDVFISDSTKTYAVPDPVSKGVQVTFHLGGIIT